MKLFETSKGFIFSFGFDVANQKRNIHMIAWCDPRTKEWAPTPDNKAGSYELLGVFVDPDHIWEVDGKVVAYQSDPPADRSFQEDIESRRPKMFELTYFGHQVVWILSVLHKDMKSSHKFSHSMYRNKPVETAKIEVAA